VFSTDPNLVAPKVTSLIGNGTPPTNAAGTGISAVTIDGNDLGGTITLTSAGTIAADGTIITINYAGPAFPNGSYPILFPGNAATAALTNANQVYTVGALTNFIIKAGASLPGVGVVYKYPSDKPR